jgi:hypothetical protein
MRHTYILFRVVPLLLGAVLINSVIVQAATLTAQVESAEAAEGEQVEIPIIVSGSPGMVAMHLELAYDPAVLEVATVDPGPLLAGNALLEFNTEEAGRVVIGFASTDQVTGDGTLAVVQFTVAGLEGDTSPLSLQNGQAWDEAGVDILVQMESGAFTVGKAGLSSDVLLFLAILCGILFVCGLFILGLVMYIRRRRNKTIQRPYQPGYGGTVQCSRCGAHQATGVRFCSNCGNPL